MYVGEMERPLCERTQEHEKTVKEGDSNKNQPSVNTR